MGAVGIDERAGRFQDDVVVFVGTILPVPGTRRVIEQLVQASGSISANRQEAIGASSKREFIRFNELALRSARETTVWLRTCKAAKWGRPETCARLFDESIQISRILAAIVLSAKGLREKRDGP